MIMRTGCEVKSVLKHVWWRFGTNLWFKLNLINVTGVCPHSSVKDRSQRSFCPFFFEVAPKSLVITHHTMCRPRANCGSPHPQGRPKSSQIFSRRVKLNWFVCIEHHPVLEAFGSLKGASLSFSLLIAV